MFNGEDSKLGLCVAASANEPVNVDAEATPCLLRRKLIFITANTQRSKEFYFMVASAGAWVARVQPIMFLRVSRFARSSASARFETVCLIVGKPRVPGGVTGTLAV